MALTEFLERSGIDPDANRNATGWQCLCPAHNGNIRCPSVSDGEDHRLLVRGHHGTTPENDFKVVGSADQLGSRGRLYDLIS